MQTRIQSGILSAEETGVADSILRACVHCGFCNATCPTYQLLGDELDGPRGRIYQIKGLLEGEPVTREVTQHLDRCLTCRACETTCPSGVRYGRLLEIGRNAVEKQNLRPMKERITRALLQAIVPRRERFAPLLRLGLLLRPVLPRTIRRHIPPSPKPVTNGYQPSTRPSRLMLLLNGCVQPVLAPDIDQAAIRVCARLGIDLRPAEQPGCCGAINHHLGNEAEARACARRNVDHWWPKIEQGAEAIVSTASGCTTQLKIYGELLQHDPDYRDKAARISELCQDISEVLASEDLSGLTVQGGPSVAFHSPCTLQHGLQLGGIVEDLLGRVGFRLVPVRDSHLCCGSAGTYSILQSKLSTRLRDNKIAALNDARPDHIATANIGCLMHLHPASAIPVTHWINLIDEFAAQDNA